MRRQTWLAILLFIRAFDLPGAIFYQGNVSGGGVNMGPLANSTIPDGSIIGIANTMDLTGQGLRNILDITVTLNVSGGYNGDLYAYLSYNGVLMPLLNRVGVGTQPGTSPFGFSTSGLNNITLASSSQYTDIHLASGVLSGTYRADGRAISPLSAPSAFDAPGTLTLNGQFGGMNPNGQWTLFFCDVVAGGGTATLLGWSLEIKEVPEPTTWALVVFVLIAAAKWAFQRTLAAKWPVWNKR